MEVCKYSAPEHVKAIAFSIAVNGHYKALQAAWSDLGVGGAVPLSSSTSSTGAITKHSSGKRDGLRLDLVGTLLREAAVFCYSTNKASPEEKSSVHLGKNFFLGNISVVSYHYKFLVRKTNKKVKQNSLVIWSGGGKLYRVGFGGWGVM